MSIDEILEEMDELLDKASSVPFVSHKKVIDGERMRELINDVRLNMPHELKDQNGQDQARQYDKHLCRFDQNQSK